MSNRWMWWPYFPLFLWQFGMFYLHLQRQNECQWESGYFTRTTKGFIDSEVNYTARLKVWCAIKRVPWTEKELVVLTTYVGSNFMRIPLKEWPQESKTSTYLTILIYNRSNITCKGWQNYHNSLFLKMDTTSQHMTLLWRPPVIKKANISNHNNNKTFSF